MTTVDMDRLGREIERHLGTLCSVARNTGCGPMRPNQQRAVTGAVAFFAGPMAAAHSDRVNHLQTTLDDQRATPAEAREPVIEGYRQAAVHHHHVDQLARRWLATGGLTKADGTDLSGRLEALQNLYARLLRAEERWLHPPPGAL